MEPQNIGSSWVEVMVVKVIVSASPLVKMTLFLGVVLPCAMGTFTGRTRGYDARELDYHTIHNDLFTF